MFEWNGKIVLIGSSTGGVEALEIILSKFPVNCPPTLISQHMPAQYLHSFSQRLNQNMLPDIVLARHESPLEQGHIYIAPGGAHHLKIACNGSEYCQPVSGKKVNGHRPSVDVMFNSAIGIAQNVVGVLLTGMGNDGAKGLYALRKSGAITIGQDQASSVVYGMPRAAAELGALTFQMSLAEIADRILICCSKNQAQTVNGGIVI